MDKSIEFINNVIESKNDYIIVGCSGGPDSMCLISILHNENYKPICAHVNHNIRTESDEELKFVQDFCNKRNIPFESLILPKNETHDESYYRKKRYNFYKELADKYNTKYIMTAHHGDDLVETILMRITRGSHIKGYMGFPKNYDEYQYKFIKPLVFYTKQNIIDFNNKNNIPSVHDYTNDQDIYTRNRYRHQILPFLKSEQKDIHLKYLKFSEELEAATNYIDKIIQKELKNNFYQNTINLELFLHLDKYIQTKELETIFKILYKDEIDKIRSFHIQNILDLLNKNSNFEFNLPNNLLVKREYNKLKFLENKKSINYNIELATTTELPTGDRFEIVDSSNDNSNFTIRLNKKDLKLPLYIRNRKDGDRIEIKNLNGSKKIKNIFIDEKIEPSIRDTYPLLVDANDNIFWVPGLRKSKFDTKKEEKCDIIIKYAKKGNTNEKK